MQAVVRKGIPVLAFLFLVGSSQAAAPSAEDPHGWLGLLLADAGGGGALVRGVVEGSPADDAHFRAKDTITALDGTAVTDARELISRVRSLDPGSSATFSVKRGAREFELRTVLDTRSEQPRLVRGWIGVNTMEIPVSLREHFGAPKDAGVLVAEVADGSPAYFSGIRIGDVIYEFDGAPVTSSRDLSRLVTESGVENDVEVVLARDGARIVVEPRIQRAPARESD
jgi:S1-C subfamily serine protease